jgi:hypothetical protein
MAQQPNKVGPRWNKGNIHVPSNKHPYVYVQVMDTVYARENIESTC